MLQGATIRLALPHERSQICGLHCANHLAASVRSEEELRSQIDDLPTDFPALFSDEIFLRSRCWVAVSSSAEIVGSLSYIGNSDDGNSIVELSSFSVKASCRGQGIGTALLSISLPVEYERGVRSVKLLTLGVVMESAIRLYKTFGFEIVAEEFCRTYECKRMVLDLEKYCHSMDKRKEAENESPRFSQPLKAGGLIFVRTLNLERITKFYCDDIGMRIYLQQPDINILQLGNLLVGFHEKDGSSCDTDSLLTFFYEDSMIVDQLYEKLKSIAITSPKENEKYKIYNFFAKDPEGRTIEFQTFLHDLPMLL